MRAVLAQQQRVRVLRLLAPRHAAQDGLGPLVVEDAARLPARRAAVVLRHAILRAPRPAVRAAA
eukprot:1932469-Prymnesium_polylepis.1